MAGDTFDVSSLRRYWTFEEVARELKTNVAGVWRLVFDGWLRLSLYLPTDTKVRLREANGERFGRRWRVISGVVDLWPFPLSGLARFEAQRTYDAWCQPESSLGALYRPLRPLTDPKAADRDGDRILLDEPADGVVVVLEDGEQCLLEWYKSRASGTGSALPDDCEYVFRPSALAALKEKLSGQERVEHGSAHVRSTVAERSSSTDPAPARERPLGSKRTLLWIVRRVAIAANEDVGDVETSNDAAQIAQRIVDLLPKAKLNRQAYTAASQLRRVLESRALSPANETVVRALRAIAPNRFPRRHRQ